MSLVAEWLARSRLVAGPLAAFTDSPWRRTLRQEGFQGIVYTEMISAHGLATGCNRSAFMCNHDPAEQPLVHQIFGSDPDYMASAASMMEQAGARVIDINMGCPQHRIIRHGEGAALMGDPEKAASLVRAIKENTSLEVIVKTRAGLNPGQVNGLEFTLMMEKAGADAIVIHPRFLSQRFAGDPDHSITMAIARELTIPLIANGNLNDPLVALKMAEGLRVIRGDRAWGIMVARKQRGNPWLMVALEQMLEGKITPVEIRSRSMSVAEVCRVARIHLEIALSHHGEQYGAGEFRGHLAPYSRGIPGSKVLLSNINQIVNPQLARDWIDGLENLPERLEGKPGLEDRPCVKPLVVD